MKGVELTINSVVMIVLAMLVLIVSAYYLTGLFNNYGGTTSVDTYVSNGCKTYAETKSQPDKIILGDIDNDGKADTLLKACQIYLKNMALDNGGCMKLCAEKFPGLIPEPATS